MNEAVLRMVIETKITISDANKILSIFKELFPQLPSDVRGVLRQYKKCPARSLGSGVYYHFGLAKHLLRFVEDWLNTDSFTTVEFHLNFDGLSGFRSSKQQLYPILGRIVSPRTSEVFLVGIYGGLSKPADFNDFSEDVISELEVLSSDKLCVLRRNIRLTVRLCAVVCDTPARSFAKYTIGHNDTAGCDKCIVLGRRQEGRMTFGNHDYSLRTNDTFRGRQQENHHKGTSNFERLRLNMISAFPLDPMHLVYLGVVKKIVGLWETLAVTRQRNISRQVLRGIDDNLQLCRSKTPRDFSR